jgi:N-methylhydantoinase B
VRAIPDGTYEADSFMDDDAVRVGQHIPLHVKVTVAGDQMTIDLTDVSRQVSGYFNSGATAGRSAAQVAFKCLTSPLVYPINDGSFTPLNIILPPGRAVSAVKPAAVRKWQTIPMTLVDTIIHAMAPAMPDKVAAGHHCDLLLSMGHGTDPRTGRFAFASAGNPGGGWGAKHDSDGMCGTVCINDGDTHNHPVEANEGKSPLIVEEYALRPDSGGAGRWRGGLGVRRVVRLLGDLKLNSHTERTQCPPWGLFGGHDALANRMTVRRADGHVEHFASGKLSAYEMNPGDAIIIESGGGGGYGPPWERPAEEVARDVREGYVSPEQARAEYGVMLNPTTLAVDEAATTALRAELRRAAPTNGAT